MKETKNLLFLAFDKGIPLASSRIKILSVHLVGSEQNLLNKNKTNLSIQEVASQSLICEWLGKPISEGNTVTIQGLIYFGKSQCNFEASGVVSSVKEIASQSKFRVEIQLRQFNKEIWNRFLAAMNGSKISRASIDKDDVVTRKAKLGEYLKTKRMLAGFSQQDVAKTLGYTSAQFISNWERGASQPPMNILAKLTKILSLDHDDLFELILDIAVAETTLKLKKSFKIEKKS